MPRQRACSIRPARRKGSSSGLEDLPDRRACLNDADQQNAQHGAADELTDAHGDAVGDAGQPEGCAGRGVREHPGFPLKARRLGHRSRSAASQRHQLPKMSGTEHQSRVPAADAEGCDHAARPVYGRKGSDFSSYNSSGLILTARGPPAPVGLARHGSRHAGEPKIRSCSLRSRTLRHSVENYTIVWAWNATATPKMYSAPNTGSGERLVPRKKTAMQRAATSSSLSVIFHRITQRFDFDRRGLAPWVWPGPAAKILRCRGRCWPRRRRPD